MSDTRKVTVTSTSVITAKDDWTLYEVFAVNEDGDPIDLKLRAFDDLPIGEQIEVEVEKRTDPKYGDSYTLKPVGGARKQNPGARLGPKVDELRERVDELEARIERLESAATALGGAPGGQPATEAEDDIPF